MIWRKKKELEYGRHVLNEHPVTHTGQRTTRFRSLTLKIVMDNRC